MLRGETIQSTAYGETLTILTFYTKQETWNTAQKDIFIYFAWLHTTSTQKYQELQHLQ